MNGQVVRMLRNQPLAWAYFPNAIMNLREFCRKYDTDTKPDELFDQVSRMFASGDLRLGLWVIIKDLRVVGHLLAQPEPIALTQGPWDYVIVRQAEALPKEDVREEARQVFEDMEKWARSLGVPKLVMLTHRREDSMARRWGWRPYKALMEKRLDGRESVNNHSGTDDSVEPRPVGSMGATAAVSAAVAVDDPRPD